MTLSDFSSIASTLATFLGVYVAWSQLSKLNRQQMLQHFADYTKRYQEIMLRFPEDVNAVDFHLYARRDYAATMRAMRAYVDLCFEEWYLNERGFIESKIWYVWRGGMEAAFSKPAFQQAWEIIVCDSTYGEKFQSYLGELRPSAHG